MSKFVPTIRFRLAISFGLPLTFTLLEGFGFAWLFNHAAFAGRSALDLTLMWALAACLLGNLGVLTVGYRNLQSVVVDVAARQASSFRYLSESLDLTRRSKAPRMDQFGRGAAWFDRFMQRLEGVVVAVRSSAEHVSVASRQIAAGNVDLSSRTERQAASLEETAASMTELAETIRQNTDNAARASQLASQTAAMANTGNDAVQAVVRTIETIGDEAGKIAEITGIIEAIAFQTNILALNAAVEAARAGEQGRGFAVVASEVRNLAQRSSAAAKDIKSLIDLSTSTVQLGTSQVMEAGATIEQVKTAIDQVAIIAGEIALASEQQTRGIEQIAQAVTQMDEATQQNAALVEQAAAAAHSLGEQVDRVRKVLSEFRISGEKQSTADV
nr:methyl-accepting chemotaxis protein [Paraburkholderia polaris]